MEFTLEELIDLIQKRIDGLEANQKHWHDDLEMQDQLDQRILELESFRLDLLLMEDLK